MEKNDSIFNQIPELFYREEAAILSWDHFLAVVKSRRSVRVFTEKRIPEEIMRRCLEVALLAPNSSNLQCWEFYWVREKEKKDQLVEACLSQPAARTAKELVVAVARTQSWKKTRQQIIEQLDQSTGPVPKAVLSYYQKLVPFVYEQGPFSFFGLIKKFIFLIRGFFKATPRGPTSWSEMKTWANKSVALACENFMLAMRASGFDTCPMEGMDAWRIKKILQLPRDADVCMVIGCGERAENGVYGPRSRLSLEQFIKVID